MSISPTKSPVRWPRAKGRYWWSMPVRVSRLRHWPMPIRRLMPIMELVPVLNKIDLPAAEPETDPSADRGRHRARCVGRGAGCRPRPVIGIPEVLEALVTTICPILKGDAERAICRRFWSTVGTTRIWAWSHWSASSDGRSEEGSEDPHDVDGPCLSGGSGRGVHTGAYTRPVYWARARSALLPLRSRPCRDC